MPSYTSRNAHRQRFVAGNLAIAAALGAWRVDAAAPADIVRADRDLLQGDAALSLAVHKPTTAAVFCAKARLNAGLGTRSLTSLIDSRSADMDCFFASHSRARSRRSRHLYPGAARLGGKIGNRTLATQPKSQPGQLKMASSRNATRYIVVVRSKPLDFKFLTRIAEYGQPLFQEVTDDRRARKPPARTISARPNICSAPAAISSHRRRRQAVA
jgi:hypothetical protein